MNKLRQIIVFIRSAYWRYKATNTNQLAGSLAFVSILAMVPLFTVVFIVLAINPELTEASKYLRHYIENDLLPVTGSKIIVEYLFGFSDKAAALGGVGVAFLLVTVLMLLNRIEAALNQIFFIKRSRSFYERVINYWVAVTFGPVVIGLAFYLMYQSTVYAYTTLGLSSTFISSFLSKLLSIFTMVLFLTFVYRGLPNINIHRRDAIAGAVFTTLSIAILQKAFECYLAIFPSITLIYGAFATLPIFLFWLYFCWEAFLIGACLVAYFSDKRRGVTFNYHKKDEQISTINSVAYSLQIMEMLWKNFNDPVTLTQENEKNDKVLTTKRIASNLSIPTFECGQTLKVLADAGWISCDSEYKKGNWQISQNPKNINASQLQQVLFMKNELFFDKSLDSFINEIYQSENLANLLNKLSINEKT